MALAEDKERVTIVVDKALLAELDSFARESRVSRSALLSGLIETGFKQTKMTKQLFGNKFVAKALRLIFGESIVKQAEREGDAPQLENAATDAIRKSIIKQIKDLSVAEAEAEISRDLGIEDTEQA